MILSVPPPLPVRRAAMIARWKPVHLGHAAVLRALCAAADEVIVGIGSSNAYDPRNPFTAEETAQMLALVLPRPVEVVLVPDLGDPPRWARMVADAFGELDLYLTANAWVRDLLADTWPILHPVALVPPEERVRVDGTAVRRAMARGEDWASLVPAPVAAWLRDRDLPARVRREFGLALLAADAPD